jgi:hypothetical protein
MCANTRTPKIAVFQYKIRQDVLMLERNSNQKIPRIYHKMSRRAAPYPQRLCRHSPWKHPPWTQIVAPWLPMSLTQAPGARDLAHCGEFPCFGRQNCTYRKIERWAAEHWSWVAATRWFDTTTNRTIVSVVGMRGAEHVGRTFTCRFGRQIERRKKLK